MIAVFISIVFSKHSLFIVVSFKIICTLKPNIVLIPVTTYS